MATKRKRAYYKGKCRIVRCECTDPNLLVNLIRVDPDHYINRGYFNDGKYDRKCGTCGRKFFYVPTKEEQRSGVHQA